VFKHVRRRVVTVAAVIGMLAASVLAGARPAAAATATATFDIWYVARTSRHLMVLGESGPPTDTKKIVAVDTSPVGTWAGTDGPVVYFTQASDGLLYRYKLKDGSMLKVGSGGGAGVVVAAGTTPAVAFDQDEFGQYEAVAFQDAGTGNLVYVRRGENTPHDVGMKMAAHTSPAISTTTTIAQIEFVMVFTAVVDGKLWRLRTDLLVQHVSTGVVAAPGTSPAINRRGDVAFQANGTGQLVWVDSLDRQHPTEATVASGQSPAVADAINSGSGLVMMFDNVTDGLVYRLDPGFDLRFISNGLGIVPGTRPSLVELFDGKYMVAFEGGDNDLWYVDENNIGHQTKLAMAPGTSPSVGIALV
jgi:hypothetical protein